LDLVEEFRAPVVDRPILAWVNQGGVLDRDEHGLTAKVRRSLADRVLERLNTPVPFAGKRYLLRMVIQMQARSLATALREQREYKPYASRW
jgi:CRISPR-associated protein Cas1